MAGLVAVCAGFPYGVVGLGLRLLMARLFFLAGQSKILGPIIPINFDIPNVGLIDVSLVLPIGIKPETFAAFETQYGALPLPPNVAAYVFSYA